MERRAEYPRAAHPEGGARPEEQTEKVPDQAQADIAVFEKDRAAFLEKEQKMFEQEYTILRSTLLELKEKAGEDPEAETEYERVRDQYLGQIVEQHARADVGRTTEINTEGMNALLEGHRGEKGKATTTFELGIESIVRKVTATEDFKLRFEMLIKNRPEGEEALPYLQKMIPEIYESIMNAEKQKREQLSPEANRPKVESKSEAGRRIGEALAEGAREKGWLDTSQEQKSLDTKTSNRRASTGARGTRRLGRVERARRWISDKFSGRKAA